MSVDAEMVVAAPQWLDDRALLRLSYETVCAFGTERLWVDHKYGGDHHALVRRADYRLVPPVAAETTFTARLWCSFYGPGYERGDLPFLCSLARWFRSKLPGCTVYYGGDSGDTLEEFTPEVEAALWDHFVINQHRPYIDHDRRSIFGPTDGIETQHCDFCNEPMMRNGWGPRFAAYWCPGCSQRVETRDGGRTWVTMDKDGVRA